MRPPPSAKEEVERLILPETGSVWMDYAGTGTWYAVIRVDQKHRVILRTVNSRRLKSFLRFSISDFLKWLKPYEPG